MKALTFILCAIALISCSDAEMQEHNKTNFSDEKGEIIVVEYDSCEYLFSQYYKGALFTHKGNCKYCKQRGK